MVKKYSKTKGNYLECSNAECKHKEYKAEEINDKSNKSEN